MKTTCQHRSLPPALLIGLALLLAARAPAQTFTTVHRFTNNAGGNGPFCGLVLSGNTLYGTTRLGGTANAGIVYRVNTDDTGFTNLYSFTPPSGSPLTNSDGFSPYGTLILSGNRLFGTANGGGPGSKGTVFAINTDGSAFTNLHSFTGGSDGATPYAGVILSSNTLYGTTWVGGSLGNGAVFAVNTDGTGFIPLYAFDYSFAGGGLYGGLVLSGGTLYGVANLGGLGGNGTVFKVSTAGLNHTTLHHFGAVSGVTSTNAGGAKPYGTLILSGGFLYGTTRYGGAAGQGVVFKLTTNGTGFAILHSFAATTVVTGTNNQGAAPIGGLVLRGNTLYGTALAGGTGGYGSVFAVRTDGSGFTNLHSFILNSNGGSPQSELLLAGDTLYGTTSIGGGTGFYGTIYSISLPPLPQLNINRSEANAILTWATNAAAVSLQSAPTITDTFTNLPAATPPHTNPLGAPQQYFRLILN